MPEQNCLGEIKVFLSQTIRIVPAGNKNSVIIVE